MPLESYPLSIGQNRRSSPGKSCTGPNRGKKNNLWKDKFKYQNEMALAGRAHADKSLNEAEPLQPEGRGLDFANIFNSIRDAVFTFHKSLWGNGAK